MAGAPIAPPGGILGSMVSMRSPAWILPLADAVAGVDPVFLVDWMYLGKHYTALRFVLVNLGDAPLTGTPEASYDGEHVEAGAVAPTAFTVAPGYAYGDPYGIDEMRPYWRFSVSGAGAYRWGIMGTPR